MSETKVRIFDLQRNCTSDGPGLRTTVFFQGCSLRCRWCHNPEGLEGPRLLFFSARCRHCGRCDTVCPSPGACIRCGACVRVCPFSARKIAGQEISTEELLSEITRDQMFFEATGGGVTFSGGECTLQIEALAELLRECKKRGISTAVDTAGDTPWPNLERILGDTDLFLFDCKRLSSEDHRQDTGKGNEEILENLKRLVRAGARVRVRVPVIPGVNDSREELEGIRRLLASVGPIEAVELLPYHALGEDKYRALGMEPPPFREPTPEEVARWRHWLCGTEPLEE